MKTARIVPGCASAPTALVAGLPRRLRLARTLEQRGFQVSEEAASADLVIADCRLLVGEREYHLCETGIAVAEDLLLQSLRKPMDGIVSRHINRRISLALTRFLVQLGVSPNVLTVIFTLIGISGGVLAMIAQPWWTLALAGGLVQLQSILDGCDGEVSRLTFRSSKLGQWLDSIGDDVTNYMFCLGLAVGQARVSGQNYLYWAGGLTLAAQCLASGVLYRRMYRMGVGDLLAVPDTFAAKDVGTSPEGAMKILRLLFKRDTFIFIIAALCALQQPLLAFSLFAAGSYIMVVGVLINDLRLERSLRQNAQETLVATGKAIKVL